MNLFYRLILLILIFQLPIFGESFSMISDIGSSAQAIALGNIEGQSRTASAIFSNPAGLYPIRGYSFSLFQTTVMNDINYLNFALSKKTPLGTIGFGHYMATINDIAHTMIDETTQEFTIKENFDYKNSVTKLSYQTNIFRRLKLGLNLSKYSVDFHSLKANGFGVDLGALYILPFATFSAYAQNINQGEIIYKDSNNPDYEGKETLPLSISTSMRLQLWDFIFFPQVKFMNGSMLPSAGVQYAPGFIPYLKFNMGYRQLLDYANQVHNKASVGMDLKLLSITAHYAYERSEYHLQDHMSYFSLSYNFKLKDPKIANRFQLSSIVLFLPSIYLMTL